MLKKIHKIPQTAFLKEQDKKKKKTSGTAIESYRTS